MPSGLQHQVAIEGTQMSEIQQMKSTWMKEQDVMNLLANRQKYRLPQLFYLPYLTVFHIFIQSWHSYIVYSNSRHKTWYSGKIMIPWLHKTGWLVMLTSTCCQAATDYKSHLQTVCSCKLSLKIKWFSCFLHIIWFVDHKMWTIDWTASCAGSHQRSEYHEHSIDGSQHYCAWMPFCSQSTVHALKSTNQIFKKFENHCTNSVE